MPWKEVNTVDLRREFVRLVGTGTVSTSELCRRYCIKRKTGYKWLQRYAQGGDSALQDRSRCPQHQPRRSSPAVELTVLDMRQRFPDWGGRKLARVMRNEGYLQVPSPSTITEILRRHGALHPAGQRAAQNYIRFEHPHPNDLWQMDFKGAFPLPRGYCHPLTVLDDHSRFSVTLAACHYERTEVVKTHLTQAFERYGIPLRMTMDNGAPWGCGVPDRLTTLGVWLIEQGISVSHSRPYHPQTQGKDERFHRTLNAELIGHRSFADIPQCQHAFDTWRQRYNTVRPHESLNMDTPIEHYQPSARSFRCVVPEYDYAPGDQVRKVGKNMTCAFHYRNIGVGLALVGKRIAFRATQHDGVYTLHFCHQKIGQVDLNNMAKRTVKGYNPMAQA
jgi:transposase InsO family protein